MSLRYPASGSRPSRQCQAWESFHGLGFKLDQSVVSYSHKLWVIIIPGHVADRTDCLSKILWLSWLSSTTTRCLSLLQKMTSSDSVSSITRIPHYDHPHRFLGSFHRTWLPYSLPRAPHFQSSLPVFSPSILLQPYEKNLA